MTEFVICATIGTQLITMVILIGLIVFMTKETLSIRKERIELQRKLIARRIRE